MFYTVVVEWLTKLQRKEHLVKLAHGKEVIKESQTCFTYVPV
jgi:hypothetical protein